MGELQARQYDFCRLQISRRIRRSPHQNYTYLNSGLTFIYNGVRYASKNGLVDLLNEKMTATPLYPMIHLKGDDIEVVITHNDQYGEEFYSFVNGQHTILGGTHLSAFKESVSRTIKEFYSKNFEYADIRNGMVAAISIKVEETRIRVPNQNQTQLARHGTRRTDRQQIHR